MQKHVLMVAAGALVVGLLAVAAGPGLAGRAKAGEPESGGERGGFGLTVRFHKRDNVRILIVKDANANDNSTHFITDSQRMRVTRMTISSGGIAPSTASESGFVQLYLASTPDSGDVEMSYAFSGFGTTVIPFDPPVRVGDGDAIGLFYNTSGPPNGFLEVVLYGEAIPASGMVAR